MHVLSCYTNDHFLLYRISRSRRPTTLSSVRIDISLDRYLQACTERCSACIDVIPEQHQVPDIQATARFHYLKIDSNGRPRWKDLAQNLAYHILSYCFSVQKREEARTDVEIMELRHEARQFFRDENRSGEAGEMLLYFLLEAILGAPQMVAKISLKTNPSLETFGSDGIHMKWHEEDGVLDVYFGEAKLYQNFADATAEAVGSIQKFHEKKMEDFELRMVTRHFKHAEDELKTAVLGYVKRGTAEETVRINHACLLGYNWDAYQNLPNGPLAQMVESFRQSYQADIARIGAIINHRFEAFKEKRLRFEIFVLPFSSVDEFREAFLKAL